MLTDERASGAVAPAAFASATRVCSKRCGPRRQRTGRNTRRLPAATSMAAHPAANNSTSLATPLIPTGGQAALGSRPGDCSARATRRPE
jgi:hypothetical protein